MGPQQEAAIMWLLSQQGGRPDRRVIANPNRAGSKEEAVQEYLWNPETLEAIIRDQKPLRFETPIHRPPEDNLQEALEMLFGKGKKGLIKMPRIKQTPPGSRQPKYRGA